MCMLASFRWTSFPALHTPTIGQLALVLRLGSSLGKLYKFIWSSWAMSQGPRYYCKWSIACEAVVHAFYYEKVSSFGFSPHYRYGSWNSVGDGKPEWKPRSTVQAPSLICLFLYWVLKHYTIWNPNRTKNCWSTEALCAGYWMGCATMGCFGTASV